MLRRILHISRREVGLLIGNPIYMFCMVLLPGFVVVFFTTLMGAGQPKSMPVGVVDADNTSTTRALTRKLDSFQSTAVTAHYNSVTEARKAMQRNEIYAFIYFPAHTTDELLSSRQPKISFYYSNACITSGSLLFKDLKTIATLGSAAVGSATLSAMGKTDSEIATFLQPIIIDLHPIGNPTTDYNVYLSTSLIPACLMLFIFLITAYSIGTEQKFGRSREWLAMAGDNIGVALAGKLLPQFAVFATVMCSYLIYIYGSLGFPNAGGPVVTLILGILAVLAAQGFGTFAFGVAPSLRMSMSICSLWAALSFSVMGATFPISAMPPAVEALTYLFPMRHYFAIYQSCVFGGSNPADVWPDFMFLLLFAISPIVMLHRIGKATREWVYMP